MSDRDRREPRVPSPKGLSAKLPGLLALWLFMAALIAYFELYGRTAP
jgi:hypothetical protein